MWLSIEREMGSFNANKRTGRRAGTGNITRYVQLPLLEEKTVVLTLLQDDMFVMDVDKEQFAMKPMNCPG